MINVLPGILAALTYLGESVAIWDDLRIEFRKMFHPVIRLEEGYQWFILEGVCGGDKHGGWTDGECVMWRNCYFWQSATV